MKNKISNYLIMIGIMIFVIGFYFMFLKAGLPYPDPTPDMTRKWMFYYNLGKVTIPFGAVLMIIGVVVKIFIKICIRFKERNNF